MNAKNREITQGNKTLARNGHGDFSFFGAAGVLVLADDDVIGDLVTEGENGVFIGVGPGNGELTPPVSDVADGVAADIGVVIDCAYGMLPTDFSGVTVTVSAPTTNEFTFFQVKSSGSDILPAIPPEVATADANWFDIAAAADSTDSLVLFLPKSKLTILSLLPTFSLLCNALKISASLMGPGVCGGGGGRGGKNGGGFVGGGRGAPESTIGGGEDGGGRILFFVVEVNLGDVDKSSPSASMNEGVRVDVV